MQLVTPRSTTAVLSLERPGPFRTTIRGDLFEQHSGSDLDKFSVVNLLNRYPRPTSGYISYSQLQKRRMQHRCSGNVL